MAKSKDKKKKDEQDETTPADAVRGAVEQAFTAALGGVRMIDDLRGLRQELETLNRRVEALEASQRATPARASAGTKPAGTRGRSAAAARKDPATRKPPARSAAKRPRTAASARKDPATTPPAESSAGRS